jgi:hypothetical protein
MFVGLTGPANILITAGAGIKLGDQSRVYQITKLFRFTVLLTVAALLVWSQAETGQITGTVTDPSGAAIPGATITARNVATGAERTASASGSGDFTITNLQPGEYSVSIESSGFAKYQQRVTLTVGAKVGVDAKLEVGKAGTVVEVSEASTPINTETQTLSTNVSQSQIRELPTLTRNPYALVQLSGNVSPMDPSGNGAGYAINGQRSASTNLLLNGAANNDEFGAAVGQSVPLDSVQEFSVLTSNFTAEFGRAGGGIVNVVTKSGTNEFHGTAYEFNRVSRLSSNTFDNNALGVPISTFTRNQFGYSFGGPVVKNKLFFFSSTEWLRIRSAANITTIIPTNDLVAQSAPGVRDFFSTYGKLKSNVNVLQQFTGSNTELCGTNAACSAFVNQNPNMPLFQRVSYSTFANAGGGDPSNQYQTVNRIDYNATDRTQIWFNYALQSINNLQGVVTNSPYQGFDTGEAIFNNTAQLSIVHTFSPSFVSQSKVVFNRFNDLQPFGAAGGNIPTIYTGTSGVASLLNSDVIFPGYNPTTPGNSIPFGGPQNFAQLYEDLSWNKGKHNLRFGGSFNYLRDNRTFGAYQDGAYYLGRSVGTVGGSIAALLSGQAYGFQAAVYPQGKYPGDTVDFPLTSPNFSRSNRYREGAAYVQDAWKVTPRLTLNIGLRWEYFGVQHNKDANLDSNFYDPANQIDTPLGVRTGQMFLAPQSPNGSLWIPSKTNFAPRLGFAWDPTGDGKMAVRGGYGIGYERNFGNVTFNVIQNPPNYATLNPNVTNFDQPILISPNNLGPFSATTGSVELPGSSIRNVDPHIQQAYSHFWSLSVDRQISPNLNIGVDYSGSRGVHLYDIQSLNQPGYGNVFLGDPCSYAASEATYNGTPTDGDCSSYLNNQYTGINRRGSKGWSNYNALNFHVRANNVGNTGLTLQAAYTWSHALDNLSSTFSNFDQGTNNGYFNLGYLNPFDPMLDKGSADFDIRHRITLGAVWDIPIFKSGRGLLHQILGGWELAPNFTAYTGAPFSIFDYTNAISAASPRAALTAPVSVSSNPAYNGSPNSYNYLTIPNAAIDHWTNPVYFYSDMPGFPSNMTGRNAFRQPGFYNLDVGAYKNFTLTERFRLQLRAEAFNLFNHANLYSVGNSADFSFTDPTDGGSTSVLACRGCAGTDADRRNVQLAVKLIF